MEGPAGRLTPEERTHLAKGKAILQGISDFLQPEGAAVDIFSITPSQASIPDRIVGRDSSQGARIPTCLWTYEQFWNSQDKVSGGTSTSRSFE